MKSKKINQVDFYYHSTSPKEGIGFVRDFDEFLSLFVDKKNIDRSTLYINKALIVAIHTRIDQRKDYYQYFHSDEYATMMSQAKEMALLCYWIVKYKPLFQKENVMEKHFIDYNCTINEKLSLFLIESICAFTF